MALLGSSTQYVEGYLVNTFQRDHTTFDDNCPDKTIYFDIPTNQGFDRGYVVLKMNDRFENLPEIQLFGDRDEGITHESFVNFVYLYTVLSWFRR